MNTAPIISLFERILNRGSLKQNFAYLRRGRLSKITTYLLFVLTLGANAQERNYDLIVLGAGPAGLATAMAAAQEGARVLIVEQRALDPSVFDSPTAVEFLNEFVSRFLIPYEQTVSERNVWSGPEARSRNISLDRSALSQLRAWDVDFLASPLSHMTFRSNPETESRLPLVEPATPNERRLGGTTNLGGLERSMLLSALDKYPGIEFVFGSKLETDDGKLQLSVSLQDGQTQTLSIDAPIVAVAEGKHSGTLRNLSIERFEAEDTQQIVSVANYAVQNPENLGEFVFALPADGLAIRHGGIATIYALIEPGAEAQAGIDKVIRRLGIIGDQLAPAQEFVSIASQAREYFVKTSDRVFLVVGDAASTVSPATGYGVTKALEHAVVVGTLMKTFLADRVLPYSALTEFKSSMQKSTEKALAEHRRMSGIISASKSFVFRNIMFPIMRYFKNGSVVPNQSFQHRIQELRCNQLFL